MANLTKRTVDAAGPRERDYALWDDDLPRFGLRVRASGTKTYVVQYRAKGRTRVVTLGRHGALTPAKARLVRFRSSSGVVRRRIGCRISWEVADSGNTTAG